VTEIDIRSEVGAHSHPMLYTSLPLLGRIQFLSLNFLPIMGIGKKKPVMSTK
jgi:hypothetical protein